MTIERSPSVKRRSCSELRWSGNRVSTVAPPMLTSLTSIGSKTMTSPSSSPRMGTRSRSRFSADIGGEYTPAGRRLRAVRLIHPQRRAAREDVFFLFGQLRDRLVEILPLVLG